MGSLFEHNSVGDQSPGSFEEQRYVLKAVQNHIDKYRYDKTMAHTKDSVVHGAPGTGKTFVGKVAILLAISCGLRTQGPCHGRRSLAQIPTLEKG